MKLRDWPLNAPNLSRRKFALGLAFASASGLAIWREPQKRIDLLGDGSLEALIPKAIGRWDFASNSGLVIPPEDQLSDALYSQLLTRVYTDKISSPIMLLIAQSSAQTGVIQIHRPEVCYPAGGYELSPVSAEGLATPAGQLRVNSLTATADARSEHIVYWTRVGEHMPVSWSQQRLAVAQDNWRGFIPDAVLVRISTINNNRESAMSAIREFISALLTSVGDNRALFVANS